MDTTNTITGTAVALRKEGDKVYAVTWDADKSFVVWNIEDVSEIDSDLGRWIKVDTCDANEAPRSLEEATQVANAILTTVLEGRTVIIKTV